MENKFVRSQVLTAASMDMKDFWDIALCTLVTDRRFADAYCFHHHGGEYSLAPLLCLHLDPLTVIDPAEF
jgi:hypothetical protein